MSDRRAEQASACAPEYEAYPPQDRAYPPEVQAQDTPHDVAGYETPQGQGQSPARQGDWRAHVRETLRRQEAAESEHRAPVPAAVPVPAPRPVNANRMRTRQQPRPPAREQSKSWFARMARKFAPGRPDNAFADESEHPRREPVIDKASAKKTSHMRADGRAAENRRQQAPAVVEHHGRHETPGPETYGPHDAAQSRAPYAGHIDADAQQVADLHYGEDYDDARLSDAETVERNEPDFAPPEPPDLAGRPDPREQYAPVRLREAAFAEDETGGDAGGKISDPRRVERAQFDERRHRDIEAGLVRNISTGGANIPYHVIDVVFAVAETATDDNDLAGCPDEAFADCKEALWRQCRYLDGDAVLFCRFGWDRDRAMFTDGKAVAFNAAMRPDEGGLRARPMQDKSVIRVWGQGTVVAFHQQAGMDGADEHDDFRNGDPHAPAIAGRQAAE